jgi:Mrr restriction endonuclease-like protein
VNPTIRIDDEVYDRLKEHAEPFVDTPNAVLRRLVGLPPRNGSEADAAASADDVIGGESEAGSGDATSRHGAARRRARGGRKSHRRAPRGTLVQQAEYELPLLQVLAERDGRAPASEAIDAVGERLDGKLTEVDRGHTSSGEVRWRNRTQFARLALVKSGDMKADSPRGVWELTEQGARRAGGDAR